MRLQKAGVVLYFTYWSVLAHAVKPMHYLKADSTGRGASILSDGHVACGSTCRGSRKEYFCASNGRTLDSICRVRQAKCHDPYLNVTAGKCKSSARCQKERTHSLMVQRFPDITQTVNVPSCKKDGSYAQIQCNVYFGYCWCVTALGKMVKDSTFEIGDPPKCGSSRRRRCNTEADKALFAVTLRNLINSAQRHRTTSRGGRAATAVKMKHHEMDANSDSSLSSREMRKLLKRYRKKLPRSCMKVFWKFCDFDQNKLVSLSEFGLCLGVIRNMGDWVNTTIPPTTVPSLTGSTSSSERIDNSGILVVRNRTRSNRQGTSPSFGTKTCLFERQELLKGRKKNVNIPDCEGPDLRYWSQVQCHGLYCYCVVRDTGAPVPATAVRAASGVPNCQKAVSSLYVSHPIEGCPSRLKNKFLTSVQRVLIQKMAENRITDEGDSGPIKERAARWLFSYMDTNHDNALGRKEGKALKKLLLKSKVSKKCLRKFTRHCDRNKDSKISIEEFVGCLEVRRFERRQPYSDLRQSIDRLKSTDDPDNS